MFLYSGYADRIHELMVISRELSAVDDKSSGSRNCSSEADYIEFAGVKVCLSYLTGLLVGYTIFLYHIFSQ